MAYVAESGGAVSLPEYEYEGQDGFCRDGSAKRAAKFKASKRALSQGSRWGWQHWRREAGTLGSRGKPGRTSLG